MWLLFLILYFFLSGAPMYAALGLGSSLVLLLVFHVPPLSMAQLALNRLSSYPLLAMPLFMLAGNLLISGGAVRRMVDFLDALIGHFRGGLLAASVAFCIFFAAMTGSGYATIAAIGSIMIPEMEKAGYSPSLRAGVIGTSGQLGNLIPPSITLVIIGALTERSVATLFAAGLIPGLCVGFGIMILGTIIARKQGVKGKPPVSWKTRGVAFTKSIPALLMPLVILGGIYTGQFTPTEAAAVSCLYAILIGLTIYGGLRSWQAIKTGFLNAIRSAVMIYILFVGISLFAFAISRSGMAVAFAELITDAGLGKLGFVLILNVFMLILGFFYNPLGLMYLSLPVLAPLCEALGISMIWLGVLWLMNGLVGAITPPMAAGLYITARVANVEPMVVFKGTLPFLGIWVMVMFLIIFFPPIALWLPGTVMGLGVG